MPNPAFLVDGHMEQKIIQTLCPGAPVRRINCNGRDVPMHVLAKFINTNIRLLGNNHWPLIILVDREGRDTSRQQLIRELRKCLDEYGHAGQSRLGMADRMVENWILADIDVVKRVYNIDSNNLNMPADHYEGVGGKAKLREIVAYKAVYHETTVGVDLFTNCDPHIITEKSTSFREFVSQFSHELGCKWLSRGENIDDMALAEA
jgi:hypothetical protein